MTEIKLRVVFFEYLLILIFVNQEQKKSCRCDVATQKSAAPNSCV